MYNKNWKSKLLNFLFTATLDSCFTENGKTTSACLTVRNECDKNYILIKFPSSLWKVNTFCKTFAIFWSPMPVVIVSEKSLLSFLRYIASNQAQYIIKGDRKNGESSVKNYCTSDEFLLFESRPLSWTVKKAMQSIRERRTSGFYSL